MYKLLYVNPLDQDIIKITNKNISIQIRKDILNDYDYFSIYFSGLVYQNNNYYIFSLYDKHNKISRKDIEAFVDKDRVYLYDNKKESYEITYELVNNLFALNEKTYIDGEKILIMQFDKFLDTLLLTKSKDITELVKDVKQVKRLASNYKNFDIPITIQKEIASPIIEKEVIK